MNPPISFCLVLHNHQPVGNFDHVFEQAYRDSYLPFLEVFEPYESLCISLHTSGPLMEWLAERHPEYLDRLANLVSAGRIEIIGGAFYEPILTMISARDRIGQIQSYSQWLTQRLGGQVRGMWVPERVWEQSLTRDLASAGVQYTLLDDFHFKNAGLTEDVLDGYYVTEDEGSSLRIFPGSERLRYLIPFRDAHETVDYLRQVAERRPGAVMVFGDDGEKFGTWPETKKHVYEDGWLRRFFDLLAENQSWLHSITLAEAVDTLPPAGKIYLPEGSYREMTEWALPVERQVEYEDLKQACHDDPHWHRIEPFVRGGYWRNFKVKYPETNEMYSRMMDVSRRVEEALGQVVEDADLLAQAQQELYRAQCNCPYWHGAFGGVYLPHLRNAIYTHLIRAENLLDRACGRTLPLVDAEARDFNFDLRPELRLSNDKLHCLIAPSQGGQIYELDIKTIAHNIQATLARRKEAYHRKVLAGPSSHGDGVASIHERVVFKQPDLDQRVHYDWYLRNMMVDRFFGENASPETLQRSDAEELGDFVLGNYEATLRRNPDRIQAQMLRDGRVGQHRVRITKGVTISSGSSTLEVAYVLENLPPETTLHFGVEWNFAGLPAGADDRYFFQQDQRLGQLGQRLSLPPSRELALADEWLGLQVRLEVDRDTEFWTYPVETVSQSEGGFELVHQEVAVVPHWQVRGDQEGRWQMTMRLTLDTSWAESRSDANLATAGIAANS